MTSHHHLDLPRHRRIIGVWAVLVTATVVAWAEGGRAAALPAALTVLGLTALKVSLVAHSYMEISHSPTWLKALFSVWVAVVFTALGLLDLAPDWATAIA